MMTYPKRAEPGNEHARDLRFLAERQESKAIADVLFGAAAEIERWQRQAQTEVACVIKSNAEIERLAAELSSEKSQHVADMKFLKAVSSSESEHLKREHAQQIERLAARVAELQKAIFDERRQWASHVCPDNDRPWLPIADAPRDGTRVELWITIGPRPYAIYGVYLEHGEAWYSDSGVVLNTPTHYRREPAGPESKPDQETKGER